MRQSAFNFKNAEGALRLSVPYVIFSVLIVLNVLALPFLPSEVLKPQFALMAVFYWAIYRPTLLPPALCFAAGILLDILSGIPIGIHALIFVTTHWIVREQRRFLMGQPYITLWAIFGLLAAVTMLLQWALHGLPHMQWGGLIPVWGNALMSMMLFPFISLLHIYIHRLLPVAHRPYS